VNDSFRFSKNLLPALAVLLSLAFAACSAGLPEPSTQDAKRAQTRFPGTTVVELNRGRALYVQTCAGCHALKAPDMLPPERWEVEVADMRTKRGVAISDQDAELIVQYLWTASTGSQARQAASR
jgi:mono/diheme cytochrome c family protein